LSSNDGSIAAATTTTTTTTIDEQFEKHTEQLQQLAE
jgi:hypothetical protein